MSPTPKILIVDDDPRMCDSLKVLLSADNYEVQTGNSGQEAIELLNNNVFDIVLLDIVMPEIDGYQVLDHIGSRTPDTLVIVITGFASIESSVEALRRGAYDYIRKPFEPEELLKRVQNALNQKKLRYESEIINRKLAISEENYRYLIQNSPDIIYTLDIHGNFKFVSNAAERFLGFKVKRLIGRHYSTVIYEEDLEKAKWRFNERRAGDRVTSGIELRFKLCNDGDQFRHCKEKYLTFELNSTGMYEKPTTENKKKYLGTYGVARDISNRKRLEVQLQHFQKMETIGTIAGGVAHDLNNVLSGIVSYPDLLLMQLPENSPVIKPILSIKRSGEKAAAIVQDLLNLARRGVSVSEVVNLNHMISTHLKSNEYKRLKLYHPEVQIETKLEENLLNMMGSPVHLGKTVMNLLSNAAEAMPGGGKVFISTENRYIDRPIRGYDDIDEGDYVTLTVSDTGVGITSEDIGRIFEPFYTKKVMGRSGTGLGMAVVWGTVKDHKGYIDVQSTKGEGARFTLFFPATREKLPKDQDSVVIDDYMGEGESILVVDDIKEQREIAFTILSELAYSVNIVSSGEEAIEYIKRNSVDLLVLDMIMEPGIDGLDTYKRILEVHPGQRAIIASGFSETERIKEAQRLGAGKYIKKPYTLEKIGLAIREELEK